MTDEEFKDIRERYPDITTEEGVSLSYNNWYKCRINFYEKNVKELKYSLQDFFKNGKTWKCDDEDKDWYKSFLRDLKNNLESAHKQCMIEYRNHLEGLNPPSCYKF